MEAIFKRVKIATTTTFSSFKSVSRVRPIDPVLFWTDPVKEPIQIKKIAKLYIFKKGKNWAKKLFKLLNPEAKMSKTILNSP